MKRLSSPQELLQKALERQIRKNPAYSLRALARTIQVSPSYLSRVLQGKKPIPEARFSALVEALSMDESSQRILREALLKESLKKQTISANTLNEILENPEKYTPSKLVDYEEASLTEFMALDHWYHIAILDLVTCADFEPSAAAIARRLGISLRESEVAIQKLFAAGILEEKNGAWQKSRKKIRFPTTKSHPAIRRYHKQMLQKALTALETQTDDVSFKQRTISSVSFAANPKNIAKARERLQEALYEVAEILTEGACTEVYQLNAQLFPLTKK